MTLSEFNQIIEKNAIIVCYFSHDECNVCKVLKPQVRELVAGFEEIEFLYVNTVESPEVSGQLMVFAVPTIIIYFDGREARRYSRHLSLQDFRLFLQKMSG